MYRYTSIAYEGLLLSFIHIYSIPIEFVKDSYAFIEVIELRKKRENLYSNTLLLNIFGTLIKLLLYEIKVMKWV